MLVSVNADETITIPPTAVSIDDRCGVRGDDAFLDDLG